MKKIDFKIMKTKLIIFLSFIISINVSAQKLSFDQLLYIYKLDFIDASDYLISRGWSYNQESEEGLLVLEHGITALVIYKDGNDKLLQYGFSNNNYYSSIKSSIKGYQMNKLESGFGYKNLLETDYSILYSIYEGNNYKCGVLIIKNSNIGGYTISLYLKNNWSNKSDYSLIGISNPKYKCNVEYDVGEEDNSYYYGAKPTPRKVINTGKIFIGEENIVNLGNVVINVTVKPSGEVVVNSIDETSVDNAYLRIISERAARETIFSRAVFDQNGTITYRFFK